MPDQGIAPCHNGHPFVPGVDQDDPEHPSPDWCNTCGEARRTAPIVDHVWNDPDGDGHNCVDCAPDSIWKCDEAAHRHLPTLSTPTCPEIVYRGDVDNPTLEPCGLPAHNGSCGARSHIEHVRQAARAVIPPAPARYWADSDADYEGPFYDHDMDQEHPW